MTNIPDVVGALVSDGLQLFEVLGGSTVGAVVSVGVKEYLQRKTNEGRELLFEELSRGDILPPQAAARDELVAVGYHYFRSASMGAARINLRLIAKGIVGRLMTNKLVADEFLPHVDALAALSRDEIVLLATMYHLHCRIQQGDERVETKDVWQGALAELKTSGWSPDRAWATAGRATRSGYVIVGSGYGSLVYRLSPLFIELCTTVDFDDALRRETKDAEQPSSGSAG
jgi:hypothetical protein